MATGRRTVRTMCPMNCHPTLCGMLVTVEDGRLLEVAGDPDNPFPTYADLAKLQGAEQDNSGSGAPVAKMVNANGTAV